MKKLFLLIIVLIVNLSCDPNNGGKLPPPGKVLLVEKFTDLGNTERGIDAVPERDGIYIEWYLLSDPDVTKYNIYRKFQVSSIFTKLTSIQVENEISPFDTVFSYIDDEHVVLDNADSLFHYYVTASNKDDVEGPASDTTGYMLLTKPLMEDIQNINNNEQPVFSWHFQGASIPNYYIIRIEDQVLKSLLWTQRFQNENLDRDKVKDLSLITSPPIFQSGSVYRGRVDVVGPDSLFSGSESNWKTFFVN